MKESLDVLMVEDVLPDAELIENTLRGGGLDIHVRRVETRDAFAQALDERRPDVIVSDHGQPPFDSLGALTVAHEKRPDVPVIVVTAAPADELSREVLPSGATEYVSKDQLSQLPPRVRRAVELVEKDAELFQLKQALAESEQLRMVIQSARDYAIVSTDLNQRVTSWNKGAERVFRYTADEILGEPIKILFATDYVRGGHVDNELRVAKQNGQIGNECWHVRKGGEQFWGSGKTMPLLDPAGNIRGFLKIVQDQTGRRLMEVEIQEHVRQQAALARFSQRALTIIDPNALARDAVALIAETLDLEFSAVLELLPDEKTLRLLEVVGWNPEFRGQLSIPAGNQSQAGYTLVTGDPVVVENLPHETRFQIPQPLRESGVISGVSVPIRGEEKPFGVLSGHSRRRRTFSGYDVHFLESIANVLSHAIGRKHTKEALQQSQERFRLSLETVQDYAIYMLDQHGRISSWSMGAERIEGYQGHEILGRPLSTFFTPEDVARELPEQQLQRAQTEGRAQGEGWSVRKDQTRFWSEWTLTSLHDEGGHLTGYIKVARDVTELRQTQDELRRSEERFRLAVEAVQDYAIYMLDAEGRVATYNLGATRLEGYQPEEIIGRPLHTFFIPEDVALGVPDQELERARTEGKSQREGWNLRKDGSRFLSDCVLNAIRDQNGTLTGFSKVARDITELKRAEEKIQRWNTELEARVTQRTRELETANKELEAFSYSVSHDLRAPLRHINAFIQLLEEALGENIPPEARDSLKAVAESARHMGYLIDDLLTFSRMGRQEMRRVPVRLTNLVHEAQLQLQGEIGQREIDWVIADLPVVEGDPATLRQVIVNLLSNALKYTASRPRARIEIGCTDMPEETVCFVRDNGVGFDMRYAEKLFGVFQRLHSPQQFEGTGIGLAIVRRVIQRHGGRVWAEGAVDRGATFYFSLPKKSKTNPP